VEPGVDEMLTRAELDAQPHQDTNLDPVKLGWARSVAETDTNLPVR
jgi:hypothetical protein